MHCRGDENGRELDRPRWKGRHVEVKEASLHLDADFLADFCDFMAPLLPPPRRLAEGKFGRLKLAHLGTEAKTLIAAADLVEPKKTQCDNTDAFHSSKVELRVKTEISDFIGKLKEAPSTVRWPMNPASPALAQNACACGMRDFRSSCLTISASTSAKRARSGAFP